MPVAPVSPSSRICRPSKFYWRPEPWQFQALLLPLLLGLAFTALPASARSKAADPTTGHTIVGSGDPRDGYANAAFQTSSQSIRTAPGTRLDLADLAANPPLGLPPLLDPPDSAAIDLGRRLFFDRRLSANKTLSCGMCHVPEQAFTQNELATPVGIEGRFVRRNAPALFNVGYRARLFHDGRENSLEAQIYSPLLAENEMGNKSRQAVLATIGAIPDYTQAFAARFADGLTENNLATVLAAYQRALLSADSPFDRWYLGGDSAAIEPRAREGFFLFAQVGCNRCHTFNNRFAHFTDDGLHRTGTEFASRARETRPLEALQIAPGVQVPLSNTIPAPERHDRGLEEVTGQVHDRFRYRTPSLRNVALTGPYMHDGSLGTLLDVVNFYNEGGGADPGKDPTLIPLNLTALEKDALVAFLEALTGSNLDALAEDARSVSIGDRN